MWKNAEITNTRSLRPEFIFNKSLKLSTSLLYFDSFSLIWLTLTFKFIKELSRFRWKVYRVSRGHKNSHALFFAKLSILYFYNYQDLDSEYNGKDKSYCFFRKSFILGVYLVNESYTDLIIESNWPGYDPWPMILSSLLVYIV